MTKRLFVTLCAAIVVFVFARSSLASGHGPVFASATPVNGRGGWTIDQAFTVREGDDDTRSTMIKTMVSYGITEDIQLSVSAPLAMRDGNLGPARMMSLMSSDKELEGLVGYRFHKRPVGIGGRFESTLYAGGSLPFEVRRGAVRAGSPRPAAGASLEIGAATGYASRAHYVWLGGGVQRFFERKGDRIGSSRLATVVYGYRPPFLRTEAGKPDLRFFGEATVEDRSAATVAGGPVDAARTLFAGPTTLLLYKAFGVEGGVLFPVHQSSESGRVQERIRLALNVSYFFWPRGTK
jgi:hypothetical protein